MTRLRLIGLAALALILFAALWPVRFVELWVTPDQRGRWYFERGDYERAARVFEDPMWKGIASYAAEDFVAATALFETRDDAVAHLYRGNALAHRDLLEEAVAAYESALALRPGFAEADLNLEWVSGILAVREAEYEDAGGTGGKLDADGFVFDDRARDAKQTMEVAEARAQGLSDLQIEEMWMRRVQTTPGDFLALKFAYQLSDEEAPE